jgi:hypothetical protein
MYVYSLEAEKEQRQAAEIELGEVQTQYTKTLDALQQLENMEEDGRARILSLLMKLEVSVCVLEYKFTGWSVYMYDARVFACTLLAETSRGYGGGRDQCVL